MKHKANKIVCDNCKKELVYEDTLFIGGHPSDGWVEVTINNKSTALHNLNKCNDFDFCSRACAGDWLANS